MLAFILNLPWTIAGLLITITSWPTSLVFNKTPFALVFRIQSFWWAFAYMKNARAMTIGHIVLLGPHLEDKDLEHELIHVEQSIRAPLIHPILYYIELFRKGYRANKYEAEAYERAGNIYRSK